MQALVAFFQGALKIKPTEFRRTALAFGYLFCIIGAFITSRIAKSGLFLEIPNYREQLPLTYIGISITVSLVMSLYSRVERRLRRDQTNTITLAAIIIITLGFRGLLSIGDGPGLILQNAKHEVYWGFFIWVEVLGTMLIVQFWSMIPEIFDSRQAKRLFAVIGGGGVLANIAFGGGVRSLVRLVGTENLLFLIAACLGCAAILVQALGRVARTELVSAKDRSPGKKRGQANPFASGKIFTTRHVQLIAVLVVLTYMVSTMVDYQFNVIVGSEIPLKDDRSAYFASFFFYTGIIAGIIQFTLTRRILERFGVLFALLLLPLFMLLGTATMISLAFGMTMLGRLGAAALTKGSENVLRYTINDSTLQLLYLPVPSHVRGRAKAVIDGVLKPLSVGVAGFLLALLVGNLERVAGVSLGFELSVIDFSWLVAVNLLIWAAVLFWLKREYVKSLMHTLRKRRLNFADAQFEISDEGTVRILEEALEGAGDNIGHIMHALELLPHVKGKARHTLNNQAVNLLLHPAVDVREAVLKYLRESGRGQHREIAELLSDASHRVRAAAVLAYCATLREDALESAEALLNDPDLRVQAATVAALIRYCGLDGVLACAHLLKSWLSSSEAEERRQAAWVLGEVGVQNFCQPLIPLLHDPAEPVRQQAVLAAGRLKHDNLIDPLIAQLERPRLAAGAAASLAAYGRDIEDTISALLNDHNRTTVLRTGACRILARLGDSHAAEILLAHIDGDDAQIRQAAGQALRSVVSRLPSFPIDNKIIDAAIHNEARRWFEHVALVADLNIASTGGLLYDALEHRQTMAQQQVLLLLGLKYPADTIDLVSRNIRSQQNNTRANAVELLDNLLDKAEKAFIIPMLEGGDNASILSKGIEVFQLRRTAREIRLRWILSSEDSWLQTCAAAEVAETRLESLLKPVKALLKSSDPICRETALSVLGTLLAGHELTEAVEPLTADPAPQVQRYARHILATVGS